MYFQFVRSLVPYARVLLKLARLITAVNSRICRPCQEVCLETLKVDISFTTSERRDILTSVRGNFDASLGHLPVSSSTRLVRLVITVDHDVYV